MVSSSFTEEDRRAFSRKLKIGFVLLVGASGGLISLQIGPTPIQIAGAIAGGLVVGAILIAYLTHLARQVYKSR